MSSRIVEQVWDEKSLTKNRLVIMLILADFADHLGICRPLIKQVAERARLSERQVQRYMRDLEERKYIIKLFEHSVGRSIPYTYMILPNYVVMKHYEGVETDQEKGDSFALDNAQKGDTFAQEMSTGVSPSVIHAPDLSDTTNLSLTTDQIKDHPDQDVVGEEKERVQREEGTSWPQILRYWQRNVGKVSEAVESELWRLRELYGDSLYEALKEAVLNNNRGNKPSFRFIEAICKRMKDQQESDEARAAALRSSQQDQAPGQGEFVFYLKNDPLERYRQAALGTGEDNE